MTRERIEKKIRNIVDNKTGGFKSADGNTDGLVQDLTTLFLAGIKKEVNIALHEQKKKFNQQEGNSNEK